MNAGSPGPAWFMVGRNRLAVWFALAGYVLSTSAIHLLHDHSAHSGCCCDSQCCVGLEECGRCFSVQCGDEHCHHCHHAKTDHHAETKEGSSRHGRPSGSNRCEDSCFACQLLAVKSLAPVVVSVVVFGLSGIVGALPAGSTVGSFAPVRPRPRRPVTGLFHARM